MTSDDFRSAAYHEAGHVVVAWALGLEIGNAEIGVNEDDSAGRVEIETDEDMPLVDKIAVCVAGLEAQQIFNAPGHENAGNGRLRQDHRTDLPP
jgi:hypothetical protein